MSIQKVKMFTVICDNCQESADEGSDYSSWSDESQAEEVAMEADWIKEKDKHYCPKCYEYDDEDELIVNNQELN